MNIILIITLVNILFYISAFFLPWFALLHVPHQQVEHWICLSSYFVQGVSVLIALLIDMMKKKWHYLGFSFKCLLGFVILTLLWDHFLKYALIGIFFAFAGLTLH